MKADDLILRSGPKGRVSKDGNKHRACGPSFETRASRAPQDEVNFERGRF
jgi:hypothetical protein